MIDPSILVGQVLDRRYRLVRFLGEGTYGRVYAAQELVGDSVIGTCAVKVIRPGSREHRAQILREFRAVSRMSHPRLIQFRGAFEVTSGLLFGCLCLALELGEGTLRDLLRPTGSATVQVATTVARDLGAALAWLHGQGAVHRDVKPENLVQVAPHWKLSDLGLARRAERTMMTASGMKGTPRYMAPEAFESKVGPGVDLWALGAMVQECLVGTLPYEGSSLGDLLRASASQEPTVVPGLPAPLDAVVRGCLVRDPQRRWTAEQVLRALEPAALPGAWTSGLARLEAVPARPEAVVPAGLATLGRNSQGFEEYRNETDGSVLVRVPEGAFRMGADDPEAYHDEGPIHEVDLPAFWIGKFPVTNEQFARFVGLTGYEAGDEWRDCAARWGVRAPVVGISWDDARAYCRWAGLRLPSEAEWEKAARGPSGSRYPWGNRWDPERAWHEGNSGGQAREVGTRPLGVSPFGCLDMAGNVWEWCSSLYRPYPYRPGPDREDPGSRSSRVLRGGSWYGCPKNLRGSLRGRGEPDQRSVDFFGFRAACGPEPARPSSGLRAAVGHGAARIPRRREDRSLEARWP